ncbi:MAG TPA: flagellar hook capping FlgD N-terminal domain-containing protein [Marmoricola sp.]|jgi:flagellar basal-body rod modification protein FlgD|nr:flagellar hook capping FlgD N-terminal domain-containing protein [Marmoricola sp.]
MTIPATESTTAVPTSGIFGTTSTSSTDSSASDDKDMFLQLLVAQMKYQDPTNPTDSSQFLAQSAQFTELEKMQDVADKTSQLFSASVSFGASGMIGKTVTYADPTGATKTGTVHGVTFGADGPVLDVGGTDPLPIASVLSISDGSASTTSTTSS